LPALPRNRIGIFEGDILRSAEGKALAEEIRATLLGGAHQVQDGQHASPATGERFASARQRARSPRPSAFSSEVDPAHVKKMR
jgi:hypothetical protein